MGSDESYFNVSVGSDEQSHKTVSTNHNLFEKKGEPKRYRTEVLPLTSLTPYRSTKPAFNIYMYVYASKQRGMAREGDRGCMWWLWKLPVITEGNRSS